nr:MAG TPA: hypothetical protein [Caudoviricetes sp.]
MRKTLDLYSNMEYNRYIRLRKTKKTKKERLI